MHRVARALIVGLVSSLWLANAVAAGSFGTPLDFDACGPLDIAGDVMVEPGTAFTGAPTPEQCEKLCSRGVKACRASVKDVGACLIRVAGVYGTFAKLNCDAEYPEDADLRKQCKLDTQEAIGGYIEGTKQARDANLDDCDGWGAVCTGGCFAP